MSFATDLHCTRPASCRAATHPERRIWLRSVRCADCWRYRSSSWTDAILIVLVLGAGWLGAVRAAEEPMVGVVIRFDPTSQPRVAPVSTPMLQLGEHDQGLVIWADNGQERWEAVRGTWQKPAPQVRAASVLLPGDVRRGSGSDTAAPSELNQLTTQLDPLLSPSVIKAVRHDTPLVTTFVTPPNGGSLLNPCLTIRRAQLAGSPLPPTYGVLTDGRTTVRIHFRQNQDTMKFSEITGLPAAWKEGLPAGRYQLSLEDRPGGPTTFVVESASRRSAVMNALEEWNQLLSPDERILRVQMAVEQLVVQQPQPYLADALDLLESIPDKQATVYLRWRRQQVRWLLHAAPQPEPPRGTEDQTGITEIDQARELIARAQWRDALARLDGVTSAASARARALADLYRAVVHAESGLEQEESAEYYFRRALAGLKTGSAADRYRAHNNYANFLLNRTQDRLFNHAFQMATGVRGLFVTALLSWEKARQHYEVSLALTGQLGPNEAAAVQINLARSYTVLADVIRTLDDPVEARRHFTAAEQAANQIAEKFIARAVARPSNVDPFVRALADSIQAHLAFRHRDAARCLKYAQRALAGYTAVGSLAGVESTERLLGLYYLRATGFTHGQPPDAPARREALRHFRMSHLLAELLRTQVPADRVGMTRAGFFARRAYVNERLIELFIEEGQAVKALYFAELAKARALQDLLAIRGTTTALPTQPRDLEFILAGWPKEVVALEYFLGTERAWVFVVNTAGHVRAHTLADAQGRPLASRELVTRVQSFLRSLDGYSARLRDRILAGRGFDHAWQDTLHRFCKELLPGTALVDLRQAHTVLIVPHHILHYFPFAALVTECDPRPRGNLEMAQPRFLIDEPCSICYAPSLATWDLLRRRAATAIKQVAAVGIPDLPGAARLPGVTSEIESARQAFGTRLRMVVTGVDADRAAAVRLLGQPGVLLIGTHGQNWPEHPLASELFFYPRGADDGRLKAAQIYGSKVATDLIILSACYTGLADRSPLPGDDLFGLQRALLQAGGRTVVTGQWDIYDQTGPELMKGLFQSLASGEPAPQALAEAQRGFLKKLRASTEVEPWLHPYFWAVYTVAGDERTALQR